MASIAMITGATSGIGKATARILAAHGYNVIITGRRGDRLKELKQELEVEYSIEVLPLSFDVREREEVTKHVGKLKPEWQSIDVLVNNAGLALGKSPLHEADPKDWDQVIDTNIKGVLSVTHAVIPFMIKRKSGHIVNIGSIAGKEVYKGGAIYNATKFAVDALSKAMRIDFLEYGIRVTQICPGMTQTEFAEVRFKGDTKKAGAVYEGYEPLKAEDIAEAIWFAVSRPAHVNINDLIIMPTAQANTVFLHKRER
ncbi:MAG TPA: SDR family NAD(P)-dependent oxidoreductase [Candidatus Peribacterales bacterium]|uniref:NAD(P)-dependent oxidoreductase n=1 Tax=Candidatus Kaiserbacteria bacterium RIFCSPHIGHO2_01_FULL_56_24 TaxID=1798487 RepID=A0A1F6DA01_9BACT|nr:MAG: NAD(P)-dependent oxidoreductase [Candidatus Kaiserbacteria bacterium RIFCSPHIGHO2_01_FULL_56_24]HLD08306.1 SDR family NAD(P)-dependent oxidoreductase [Candidatus Peribacterales bacterium]